MCSQYNKFMMSTQHAAPWSTPCNSHYRTTHHKKTKQCGMEEQRVMDSWTWEMILDGKGPWRQAGEYRRPPEEMEAAKAERRFWEDRLARQEEERQPQDFLGAGAHGTVGGAEDGTRASRGEMGGERSRDSKGVDGKIGGERYERAAVLVF